MYGFEEKQHKVTVLQGYSQHNFTMREKAKKAKAAALKEAEDQLDELISATN